jgi:hypothetical protein
MLLMIFGYNILVEDYGSTKDFIKKKGSSFIFIQLMRHMYTLAMVGQYFQNRRLSSVKHLTKWFLLLCFFIVTSDDITLIFCWRRPLGAFVVLIDGSLFNK